MSIHKQRVKTLQTSDAEFAGSVEFSSTVQFDSTVTMLSGSSFNQVNFISALISALPSAANFNAGTTRYTSNGVAGDPGLVTSDGTNWKTQAGATATGA